MTPREHVVDYVLHGAPIPAESFLILAAGDRSPALREALNHIADQGMLPMNSGGEDIEEPSIVRFRQLGKYATRNEDELSDAEATAEEARLRAARKASLEASKVYTESTRVTPPIAEGSPSRARLRDGVQRSSARGITQVKKDYEGDRGSISTPGNPETSPRPIVRSH